MNTKLFAIVAALAVLAFVSSCKSENSDAKKDTVKTDTAIVEYTRKVWDRTKASNIYEVNIRQYTPEGTFKAFETHIPRLKQMGVDILWLMPIFPISEKNRKGGEGSYYAVADYMKVNPKFGTESDLKSLIKTAHDNGMLVILDWVANHTGCDHSWTVSHPEWYTKDSAGNITMPQGTDWTDVADLDYDNKDMRAAMTSALAYWVKDFEVDGYRCDVAEMIPTEFWDEARPALEKIRPVFLLAEAENPVLHKKAFDMSYAWGLHEIFNKISKGENTAVDLKNYYDSAWIKFPKDIYRMAFTSNHDENTWNGSEYERLKGGSHEMWAVFTFVAPGMPLIYSGQEAGNAKRLLFFEKDQIAWKKHRMTDIYTKLTSLKKDNPALWNGSFGGDMQILQTNLPETAFAFVRTFNDNRVLAVFNLSDKKQKIALTGAPEGKAVDYFTQKETELKAAQDFPMDAWGYKVFILK